MNNLNKSCFDLIVEELATEESFSCKGDRLEIYDLYNAQLITMGHETTANSNNKTAVLCGNCKYFFHTFNHFIIFRKYKPSQRVGV